MCNALFVIPAKITEIVAFVAATIETAVIWTTNVANAAIVTIWPSAWKKFNELIILRVQCAYREEYQLLQSSKTKKDT